MAVSQTKGRASPLANGADVERSYIDAHCHLADPRLAEQLDEVLERAAAVGVREFVQGGVDPDDWQRQLRLAARVPGLHPCFGLHPWWAAEASDEQASAGLQALAEALASAVALGETGLDYLPRFVPESYPRQESLFRAQLALAREREVPLVLHVVRAHERVLELLRSDGVSPRGGLVHAFSASREVAERYLALGFTISVGGRLVGSNSKKLRRAVAALPPERLVLESDAPDLSPPRLRGQLNEPATVVEVAAAVAEITCRPAEAVLRQSATNVRRLFALE